MHRSTSLPSCQCNDENALDAITGVQAIACTGRVSVLRLSMGSQTDRRVPRLSSKIGPHGGISLTALSACLSLQAHGATAI